MYGNSQDGQLINYQIEVYFDPVIFSASTCGGALQGFTCTLNDPLERAKLIATDTASTIGCWRVLLGTFTPTSRRRADVYQRHDRRVRAQPVWLRHRDPHELIVVARPTCEATARRLGSLAVRRVAYLISITVGS